MDVLRCNKLSGRQPVLKGWIHVMTAEKRTTILFQGDSITDAGRSGNADEYRGSGYPTMAAGQLNLREPGKYTVINRGISGNRVLDLYARWKRDCLNLCPDVVSILIGVNDVWHELDFQNGVDANQYEMVYNLLLDETQEKLPGVKLIVLEPFVLKGTATAEHWEYFAAEVAQRAAAAKRVAQAHKAVFVPLQKLLDDACADGTASSEWLIDGVHPTAAGHALIAREWLAAFDSLN